MKLEHMTWRQVEARIGAGAVGSHSASATPEDGARLLTAAAEGIADAFRAFADGAR